MPSASTAPAPATLLSSLPTMITAGVTAVYCWLTSSLILSSTSWRAMGCCLGADVYLASGSVYGLVDSILIFKFWTLLYFTSTKDFYIINKLIIKFVRHSTPFYNRENQSKSDLPNFESDWLKLIINQWLNLQLSKLMLKIRTILISWVVQSLLDVRD